jgi:hypothetical protein
VSYLLKYSGTFYHPLREWQGNLTSCLNFDFAILNLFEPSAL